LGITTVAELERELGFRMRREELGFRDEESS
jgi:hypothetical protein